MIHLAKMLSTCILSLRDALAFALWPVIGSWMQPGQLLQVRLSATTAWLSVSWSSCLSDQQLRFLPSQDHQQGSGCAQT